VQSLNKVLTKYPEIWNVLFQCANSILAHGWWCIITCCFVISKHLHSLALPCNETCPYAFAVSWGVS
jgi:hypothetical protein